MQFAGRKPRLVACGGRDAVFDRFLTQHLQNIAGYVAIWIDSEDPILNPNTTWAHLQARDGWNQPPGAHDEQVLFMTTCMETWLVTDRAALREYFGQQLQESALPPLNNLEQRVRGDIQEKLFHATRNCSNPYQKDRRSFEILGYLSPGILEQYLPSFARVRRILNSRL